MGKQETRAALEAMANDVEIASAVEKGDFTGLEAGDLTPAERALLSAAAGDLDDTTGFAQFKVDIDGLKAWKAGEIRPPLRRVLEYIKFDG